MLIWDLAQYTLKLSPCFFAVQFEATWQPAAQKLAAHPPRWSAFCPQGCVSKGSPSAHSTTQPYH